MQIYVIFLQLYMFYSQLVLSEQEAGYTRLGVWVCGWVSGGGSLAGGGSWLGDLWLYLLYSQLSLSEQETAYASLINLSIKPSF